MIYPALAALCFAGAAAQKAGECTKAESAMSMTAATGTTSGMSVFFSVDNDLLALGVNGKAYVKKVAASGNPTALDLAGMNSILVSNGIVYATSTGTPMKAKYKKTKSGTTPYEWDTDGTTVADFEPKMMTPYGTSIALGGDGDANLQPFATGTNGYGKKETKAVAVSSNDKVFLGLAKGTAANATPYVTVSTDGSTFANVDKLNKENFPDYKTAVVNKDGYFFAGVGNNIVMSSSKNFDDQVEIKFPSSVKPAAPITALFAGNNVLFAKSANNIIYNMGNPKTEADWKKLELKATTDEPKAVAYDKTKNTFYYVTATEKTTNGTTNTKYTVLNSVCKAKPSGAAGVTFSSIVFALPLMAYLLRA